jgi:ribosome-binding protein aMBF1 (putative translation factor)
LYLYKYKLLIFCLYKRSFYKSVGCGCKVPSNNYSGSLSEQLQALHLTFAHNIAEARKARGWSQQEAADRCLLSRGAYRAAEAGNLGTAIGIYWVILDTLGLTDGIAELAAPHRDEVGRRTKVVSSRK